MHADRACDSYSKQYGRTTGAYCIPYVRILDKEQALRGWAMSISSYLSISSGWKVNPKEKAGSLAGLHCHSAGAHVFLALGRQCTSGGDV